MLKKIIALILVLLALSFVPFLPWYYVFIVCFISGALFIQTSGKEFLIGFTSMVFFWGFMMLFYLANSKAGLPAKVATILKESTGLGINTSVLFIITILLGGILGGLSSLSASLLFLSKKSTHQQQRYKIKL